MKRLKLIALNSDHSDANETELARRSALEQRLSEMSRPFALAILAPHGLSGVNRLHGHRLGDELIEELGSKLSAAAPERALVAHLTGAKLAVLVEAADQETAEAFADELRRNIDTLERGDVCLRVRTGLCWCADPEVGEAQADEAISSALASIDQTAADAPPTTYVLDANANCNQMATARRALGALRAGCGAAALQPVVDADGSGRVLFREALIRVVEPDGSSMPAGAFVPILDRLGMMEEVDVLALRLAFEKLGADPSLRLSVNLSGAGIAGRRWFETFHRLASNAPDCAERLIVEVTEEAALEDAGTSTGVFTLIRALGSAIAIDDFGAGRTSFSHLRDFRFDMVKIDGGFISGIDTCPDNQMLVAALVAIARQFDMLVVAEFVETAAEARKLRELGVDGFQGFLFGRPALVWSNGEARGVTAP